MLFRSPVMGGFHFHGDGEGAAGEWFSSEKGANLEGFKTALAKIPQGPRAIVLVANLEHDQHHL